MGELNAPGDPSEERAGPSFPAEVKTVIPHLRVASAKTSDTRPESGCHDGSPYDKLIKSQLYFFDAINARTKPVPVSADPIRPSPILHAKICAPGATPFFGSFSPKFAAVIPATCVPCEPASVTIDNVFPSS
jgi:hypothetical protein